MVVVRIGKPAISRAALLFGCVIFSPIKLTETDLQALVVKEVPKSIRGNAFLLVFWRMVVKLLVLSNGGIAEYFDRYRWLFG